MLKYQNIEKYYIYQIFHPDQRTDPKEILIHFKSNIKNYIFTVINLFLLVYLTSKFY